MFQKFKLCTKTLGRDDRFIYLHQSMWRGDDATASLLYRVAITDRDGIVPTQNLANAMDQPDWNPKLPEWVQNWIKAEGTRTWPPIA
jgi:hypothetical protein